MTTFNILRWDALIESGSMEPKPMVYIRDAIPQTDSVLAVVTGTNSEYDGKQLIAGIRKPYQSELLAMGQSFSDCSVVVLYAPWNGYPPQLGSVTLFEVTKPERKVGGGDACDSSINFGDVTQKNQVAEATAVQPPAFKCKKESSPMTVSQIIGVWVVIIAIYGLLSTRA